MVLGFHGFVLCDESVVRVPGWSGAFALPCGRAPVGLCAGGGAALWFAGMGSAASGLGRLAGRTGGQSHRFAVGVRGGLCIGGGAARWACLPPAISSHRFAVGSGARRGEGGGGEGGRGEGGGSEGEGVRG